MSHTLSDVSAAPAKPPVHGAVNFLQARADTLDDLVDSVVSRLEHVMSPSVPKPAAAGTASLSASVGDAGVPHVRLINGISDQLSTQIERLRDVLERLAI